MLEMVFIAAFLMVIPINAGASYFPGTYTLASGIGNGSWVEFFPLGEGQAGTANFISATGTNWSIIANVDQPAQTADISSGYDFYTVYNVLFEFTAPGPWGDYFTLQNVVGENYSKRASYPDGNVAYNFSTAAIFNNYLFQLEAVFNSINGDGSYSYDAAHKQHGGSTFDSITLNVSQVPIPTTLWLFGTGLVGLVGIRRKLKS